MIWWGFFFLKRTFAKYKLFSCVCPGPGLLNSKLEFSIQKAQRTQQPMSISLSKFASLSHSCAENGNECILHMYTFGYTRTTTLWLKWTLLQIGFKMWHTKLQYFFFHFSSRASLEYSKSVNIDQGICCNKSKVGSKWKLKKIHLGFFLFQKFGNLEVFL